MIAAAITPPIVLSVFLVFGLKKVIEIKGKKPKIGVLIGEEAVAIDKITKRREGYVMYKGEYWKAISNQTIRPKDRVIIVGKSGPILIVKKKT
jgi:membrane-bound serine protease (ClpP class)